MEGEDAQVPRLYQTELFEVAKTKNIIVRADTGVGKTLVATLLVRWIASQPVPATETGDADTSDPTGGDVTMGDEIKHAKHRIQVFLVPTRLLVQQQAAVLKRQTNLRIEGISGAMRPELWKRGEWTGRLIALDVLVCTHQVLLDVLNKGFWTTNEISLMIFDEAHHCQDSHPSNQIMQSHYHRLLETDPTCYVPRILGMTASAIWNFKSLQKAKNAVDKLQRNLAAQLYEVKNSRQNLESHTHKPVEQSIYYEPELFDFPEELESFNCAKLFSVIPEGEVLDRFVGALLAARSLGLPALMYFLHVWTDDMIDTVAWADAPVTKAEFLAFQDCIRSRLGRKFIEIETLPDKLKKLIDTLVTYSDQMAEKTFSGILFVERRMHCKILDFILSRVECLNGLLKPVILVGHGDRGHNVGPALAGMGSQHQDAAIEAFRKGERNFAIATNVAEEGLDIPACSLVIRFDEITTWKGYIQSRGRARAENSDYIVMINAQEVDANKYLLFAGQEKKLKEDVYDQFDNLSIDEADIDDTPEYRIPISDGRWSTLTYPAALTLVSQVCQQLPHEAYTPVPKPVYTITPFGYQQFQATVTLPMMAELPPDGRTFVGPPMSRKATAKRGAAYEACLAMIKVNALTEHLLPPSATFHRAPMDANGRSLDGLLPAAGLINYTCQSPLGHLMEHSGWLHRATVSFGEGEETVFGLVSGKEIPASTWIFYDHLDGRPITVSLQESKRLEWPDEDKAKSIALIDDFNRMGVQAAIKRRGYDDDFAPKKLEGDEKSEFLLYMVPLLPDETAIDWSLVESPLASADNVEELQSFSIAIAPLRQLKHRVLTRITPCDVITVDDPPSLIPDLPELARFRSKANKKWKCLHDYYRVTMQLDDAIIRTPLVYADSVITIGNNLVPPGEILEKSPIERLILPSGIIKFSRLPTSFWRLFTLLPAITRRAHDTAQAVALKNRLGLPQLGTNTVITAVTVGGLDNDLSYQTLETIGDAFLKLALSVHLYLDKPGQGEGILSCLRSASSSNRYLWNKGLEFGIMPFVINFRYRWDTFCCPYSDPGQKIGPGQYERPVSWKVLADVVEALMGAAFLDQGILAALAVGEAFNLCFGGVTPWADRLPVHNLQSDRQAGPAHVLLQEQLGYTFQQPYLLLQALTHRSADSGVVNCYEREEWLGDAVLDMWITHRLYDRFAGVTDEEITFTRAVIVCNASIGFMALRRLELHKIIDHHSLTLEDAYVAAAKDIETFASTEDFYRDHNNLFTIWDPPKILGDALEAILGAMFVDSKFELEPVYKALDKIFEEVIPLLTKRAPRDPVSSLNLLLASKYCTEVTKSHILSSPSENIGSHRIHQISWHGQVIGSGKHRNSDQVAEQMSSKQALDLLSIPETWTQCSCSEKKRVRDQEAKEMKKSKAKLEVEDVKPTTVE